MLGRLIGLALDRRRLATSSPVAVALLVAANAIPLAGVLWLGWDLVTIVRIYWLENGVVGLFAVLRILTAADAGQARPGTPPEAGAIRLPTVLTKAITVPFFAFHYGVFWLAHGAFVWFAFGLWLAPGTGGDPAPGTPDPFADPLASAFADGGGRFALVGVALLISHGASFLLNWIGRGEYRTATTNGEMRAPYARVIVLHLTILFGAFAVAILGAPLWALVVMVVVKTIADLGAHVRDRERALRRAPA